jgi:membrane protease YdiL (CAAX protease family)
VVGSVAFFAIYHQPLAWPLVFSVGALNAVLFKKTRRLAPAVVLHMLYNAMVLSR